MINDVNRAICSSYALPGIPMRLDFSTRTGCRPPSKAAVSHASTMASASPAPITRAPMAEHVGVVVGSAHLAE